MSQQMPMLTKGSSLCFWLVNVNCLCYPYMSGMSTVARAYSYSPLSQDQTKLQVINPLTFRAQSSKGIGVGTEKAFILPWAIYMQSRPTLLCQERSLGEPHQPSVTVTQKTVSFLPPLLPDALQKEKNQRQSWLAGL